MDDVCIIVSYVCDDILFTLYCTIRFLNRGSSLSWLLNLSDLGTNWSKNWLVDFNTRKPYFVSFSHSNSSGAIDAKNGESVLEGRSSFHKQSFFSKLDGSFHMESIFKNVSKKI